MLVDLVGNRLAILREYVSFEYKGKLWEANPGLVYDGASIPRIFWWLIGSPFTGHYREAAVLHDAYYANHRDRTRKQTDKMFKAKMLKDDVSTWKIYVIYTTVRLAGWMAWAKNK